MVADHLADLCCAPTETSRAQPRAPRGSRRPRRRHRQHGRRTAVQPAAPGRGRTGTSSLAHGAARGATASCSPRSTGPRTSTTPTQLAADPARARPRSRCQSSSRSTPAPRPGSEPLGLGSACSTACAVVDPLGYRRVPGAGRASRAFLVSDSGGVQEEVERRQAPGARGAPLDRAARGAGHLRPAGARPASRSPTTPRSGAPTCPGCTSGWPAPPARTATGRRPRGAWRRSSAWCAGDPGRRPGRGPRRRPRRVAARLRGAAGHSGSCGGSRCRGCSGCSPWSCCSPSCSPRSCCR